MLNKANITWSAKQVAKMTELGKLTFNNVIQRSYVWEKTRKSELIHSMLEGYPIPPFYAKKVDGKIYDFLDGKQRLSTIVSFLNDEWELVGIAPIEVENDEGEINYIDINGKKFSELTEDFRDIIKDYSLTIYYYENITSEQTRILFKKLNNGKPLSSKERNIANCVDIDNITAIGNHPLFSKIMTQKSLEARKHLPIIMKMYIMITQDILNISFESKDFNDVISTAYMTDREKEEILAVLNKASSVYDILADRKVGAKARMKSETHLVSLVPFIKRAIEENISDELLADFIEDNFSKDVVVSASYSEAASKGSAKPSAIVTRNDEIEEAWNKFFEIDED